MVFSSRRRLLDLFPCSALLGPTVDTCFYQFTEAFVLGSCDRFSSCSLCYRIQRTAWSSVVHVKRQSTECSNFLFFYVKRWITDPEVDFRFLAPDSHLFVASPKEYMIWIFWEMTSGIIFSIQTLSGLTVDTRRRQSMRQWHVQGRFCW